MLMGRQMAKEKKDAAAQAMVRKRWDRTTSEQRSEIARQLNEARWGKKKGKKRGEGAAKK